MVPIEHNSYVAGWLRFDIPDTTIAELQKGAMTITIFDIYKNRYDTPVTLNNMRQPGVPGYVPGSGDNVAPNAGSHKH